MQIFEFEFEKKKRLKRPNLCCYVIITRQSLMWTVLSIAAFMTVFAAVITPRWLVSKAKIIETIDGKETYRPTVGIFNRCTWMDGRNHCGSFNMDGLATDTAVFPGCWKASLFFMGLGLATMGMSIAAGLLSPCFQSIAGKSIFNVAGAAQAVAGIFYLFGLILYPAGWGAERVKRLCGPEADTFYSGNCTFGWAYLCAMIGVFMTFICAVTSNQAEESTSSDRVQDEMNEGKKLICLI